MDTLRDKWNTHASKWTTIVVFFVINPGVMISSLLFTISWNEHLRVTVGLTMFFLSPIITILACNLLLPILHQIGFVVDYTDSSAPENEMVEYISVKIDPYTYAILFIWQIIVIFAIFIGFGVTISIIGQIQLAHNSGGLFR